MSRDEEGSAGPWGELYPIRKPPWQQWTLPERTLSIGLEYYAKEGKTYDNEEGQDDKVEETDERDSAGHWDIEGSQVINHVTDRSSEELWSCR
jgi:hypothetical protein